jgi:hypothetical protein
MSHALCGHLVTRREQYGTPVADVAESVAKVSHGGDLNTILILEVNPETKGVSSLPLLSI